MRNLSSQITAFRKYGTPIWKDGQFQFVPGRKGFDEINAPLYSNPKGSLVKNGELYAAARRAKRLITETNRDGTSREKNFTQKEIDAGLDQAKMYPELVKWFDDLQEMFKQLLDLGEQCGIIDPEARKIYERYDYVPFYRVGDMKGMSGRATGGLANQREMSGRLTGKAAPLRNVLENIAMNAAHMMDAAQKNMAMQAIVDYLQGVVVKKIPRDTHVVYIDNKQIEKAMKALGLEFDPKITQAQREMWSRFFHRVAPTDPDVVRVMRGGKPEYHRVLDPVVLRALTNVQGKPKWLRDLDKWGWLSKPKRLFTAGVTASPWYTARRFVRVMMDTWMQSPERLNAAKNTIKDFYDAFNGNKDLYDMMMAGAGGAQNYDDDPTRIRQQLIESYSGPNKWTWPWRTWRRIQQTSHQVNMLRVYRANRARGKSIAESAFRARDIEDLTMHGDHPIAQLLNASVPFLNARAQGSYRHARGYQENWRAMLLKGSMVTAASLALQMENWSNPRYQELPGWQKDAFWNVFVGDHHFMLPKPFELGLLYATIPEHLVAATMHALDRPGGETTGETLDAVERALTDTLSIAPPQTFRPFVYQAMNSDSLGRKIVSDSMSELPPQGQDNAYTSPTLREIASRMPGQYSYGLNSPARLQALVDDTTGTLGMFMVSMADVLTRKGLGYPDAPAKSLLEEATRSVHQSGEPRTTKYTDELYDFMDQADKAYKEITKLEADHRDKKAREFVQDHRKILSLRSTLNDLGKQMRELTKQQYGVMDSTTMTADEKKAALDRITKAKNDVARRVAPFEAFF